MENTKRKPGAPKKPDNDKKLPVALRLNHAQTVKYRAMGSGKWVRSLLDYELSKGSHG